MKRLMLLTVFLLAMAGVAIADGVVGHTLNVNNSNCTISFTQGPFGAGEDTESGPALLNCDSETLPMTFIYQPPELVIYGPDYAFMVEFANIRGVFRQLAPDGLELSEE